MILSPLQNNANGKPFITQGFGLNPALYAKWGFKGHEGLDLRAPIGTEVFAPIEGTVEVVDSGISAYGLHVNIVNDRFKVILAHLSSVSVTNGTFATLGAPIGLSGDSGSAKGQPHLHLTVMRMVNGQILSKDNGYGGGVDVSPYIITWQGTLTEQTL